MMLQIVSLSPQVPVLDKMLRDTMNTCLVAPLVAAEAAGRTAAAAALAQAWLAYLAALQARQSSVDETKLVEQALKVRGGTARVSQTTLRGCLSQGVQVLK